ncbi:arginine--tRNA ligase [candidate division KSB1 bacterium]|nr:arginine--tRNA ligase [candidate division KSB1 bacterium]
MNSPKIIETTITDSIRTAIKTSYDVEFTEAIKLDAPPDEKMGDFAFGCFPLAKILRASPVQIAQKLAPAIAPNDLIDRVQPAGPYLNFFINNQKLFQVTCSEILSSPDTYGFSDTGKDEKILIEYSAPNTNKPQHLGHIRNNCLGIALTNLLRAIGHDVAPVNLVNDRGVHICKSMLAYQEFGEEKTPKGEGIKGDHFVGSFYVKYEKEQKREWQQWLSRRNIDLKALDDQERRKLDAQFLAESRWYTRVQEMLQKWEAGDPEIKALWQKMNDWVYEGFDVTYSRLGCRFEKVYKESETYELGKQLVLQGLKQGIFYQKPDGSVWVDLEDQGLDHKILLRRDGTSVYITQDLGTTKLKFDDFKMQRAIWIVADEQIYHFKVLFGTLKKLGFDWADGCFHLAYGMVDLPEGKMKSREGTVVDADDLMDQLFQMERAEIQSRDIPIPKDEFEQTAEILAQGALKFYILKFGPQTRMTFDPKESISPLGFTGPYIQYAYVRVRSIFRKADGLDFDSLNVSDCDFSVLGNPEEVAIARKLHDFPTEVEISARTYNPSRLCTYLFELAKTLNTFYHDHSVLKAETEALIQARLVLSKAVAIVLRQGLRLLGIDVPERM